MEPEIRRRTASLSTPHRASDIQVDPERSAVLFRDARGVSTYPIFKIQYNPVIVNSKLAENFRMNKSLPFNY